jgi:hypothetical protein
MTRRLLALVAVAACALTACGGGGADGATASTPPPAVSTTPPASVSPPDPGKPDLLTGAPPAGTGPVIALKVDNGLLARKYQRGLDKAALVYQELVEGGATRFVAVFSGAPDVEVGPIRSARQSDLELLQQFGPIGLGFSGANAGVAGIIAKAVRAGTVTDVSYNAVTRAYRLGEQRSDARNFFTNPSQLAAAKPGAGGPKDIGLVFSPTAPAGTPAPAATVRVSASSVDTVTWNAATSTWTVAQGGTPVNGLAPANVVVQYVKTTTSQFKDVNGSPTPYTQTIGTGKVSVLRNGVLVSGTWSRPKATDPTTLKDAAGAPLPLAPGPTFWVLLPTSTGSVSVG